MYTCLNENSATIKDNARIEGTFEFILHFSLKYNDKMLEYLATTRCVKYYQQILKHFNKSNINLKITSLQGKQCKHITKLNVAINTAEY